MANIAKPLAYFFAFAGVLVAWLGIGTFSQVNSITASLQNSFDWSPKIVSIILALITAAIILVVSNLSLKFLKRSYHLWLGFISWQLLWLSLLTLINFFQSLKWSSNLPLLVKQPLVVCWCNSHGCNASWYCAWCLLK